MSLFLSAAATATLHFLYPATIAEFALAILTIICASFITRVATHGIRIRLQSEDFELCAGIFHGTFG